MEIDGVTFESLMTASGAVVAGAIVTAVVELLKRVIGPDLPGTGALWAFALSAVLYVLAAVATGVGDLNGALTVFLAWLACATAAVGIHSAGKTVGSGLQT